MAGLNLGWRLASVGFLALVAKEAIGELRALYSSGVRWAMSSGMTNRSAVAMTAFFASRTRSKMSLPS
jgi:hypothetical protein